MGPPDLAEWVWKARNRDREARGKIYVYLAERLLPKLQAITPPQIDAEDLFHDTIIAVWEGLPRLRDGSRLFPYSLAAAWWLLSRMRKESLRWSVLETGDEITRVDPAERNLEREELLAYVVAALRRSSRPLFQALYVDGATNLETAALLGWSPSLLRFRKHGMIAGVRDALVRSDLVDPIRGGGIVYEDSELSRQTVLNRIQPYSFRIPLTNELRDAPRWMEGQKAFHWPASLAKGRARRPPRDG